MRVLWLTSWYPNEINKTNGDFVQRQAQATSLYCKVDVIHLEQDASNKIKKKIVCNRNHGNLSETIVLYNPPFFYNKFTSLNKYKKLFKQEINKYIKQKGLPDLVHVHVPMKAGVLALWIKKKYKISYIITEHWTMYADNALDNYDNKNFVFKSFIRNIFKNALLVLPVSNNLGTLISQKVVAINYRVVHNVVDTNHFFLKKTTEQKPFTFIHVSTLKPQKNPEIIIEAFLKFCEQEKDSRLIIVGEVQTEIKKYVNQNSLITFTGEIPYFKVAEMLQQTHAFVLFSLYENMPCAVLEALCCGLPVITSNVGGLSEIIDVQNGILVENYNKDDLVKAMTHVCINYHRFNIKSISAKAIDMFSYETIGKQITNIYEELISVKHSTQH